MISEREFGSNKIERGFYLKELRLITPELANELGIKAESPVFVSPMVHKDNVCLNCGVTYRSLVYASGSLVEPHHFHPSSQEPYIDGGIYLFRPNDFRGRAPFGGWIAMIEPQGRMGFESVERAFVRGMKAYCRPKCCGEELHSGFVVTQDLRFMVPSCESLNSLSHRERVRYSFKIVEGTVLFSELSS